jgi:hypothetical protein
MNWTVEEDIHRSMNTQSQHSEKRKMTKNYYYGMAYAVDVNLLGDNIDTINKNTQTLIDASK